MCVCTYHQNPELLLNRIEQKDLILDDLRAKAVCEFGRRVYDERVQTMPREKRSPKISSRTASFGTKSVIKYKPWVTVNQCNLDEQTEVVKDFINNLAAAIIKLLSHHYVSQKQSFFNECKESLIVNESVSIRDFSENYSLCKMLYKGFIGIILNVLFILLYFTIKAKRMVFLAMKAFASFQNV